MAGTELKNVQGCEKVTMHLMAEFAFSSTLQLISTLEIEFIHDVFTLIICNCGTAIPLFHNMHFAEILY